MKYRFLVHLEETIKGYIVSVNGIAYSPTTLPKALSLVKGIHVRFSKSYPITFTDKCHFHLTKGEKDFATNKSDVLVYY